MSSRSRSTAIVPALLTLLSAASAGALDGRMELSLQSAYI
jgi:hypothetical protein